MQQQLDSAVQKKFLNLACRLDPESLFRDGEATPTEARNTERALRKEWRNLESLIGRKVSTSEVWSNFSA